MVGEPLMNWMRKRFTRRLLFFVFLLLLSACDDPAVKDGAAGAAALTVIVTPAEKRDVPLTIDMVGTTLGTQDVPIRARVEGFLESMDFQEGTFVSTRPSWWRPRASLLAPRRLWPRPLPILAGSGHWPR
jgi:multidrug efflux pump subunit AcrA (membrane-fusion protein)